MDKGKQKDTPNKPEPKDDPQVTGTLTVPKQDKTLKAELDKIDAPQITGTISTGKPKAPVAIPDTIPAPRDKALQPPKAVQPSAASADQAPCPSCGNVGRYKIKSAPPQERCSACFKPFPKGT
jgi:hypothetical protein